MAATRDGEAFGLGTVDGAVRVYGGQVSGNYFSLLQVPMAMGRGFTADDERLASAVTVLSHRLWQDHFHGTRDILGTTVRLNGRPFTVVGVSAIAFTGHGMALEDLWVPLTTYPEGGQAFRLDTRQATWLLGLGRLKPGVSLEQARAEVAGIAAGLEREYPEPNRGRGLDVAPLSKTPHELTGAVSGFVAVLFALVGVILLIACANVAAMLLARGVTRQREMAVRLALGATRAGIARLLVTESVMIALAGAVLGLAGAFVAIGILRSLIPIVPIALALDLRLDWRVMTFSALVSVLSGLACGAAQLWQSHTPDLVAAMTRDGAGAPRPVRLRELFVASQVALAVLLVVSALLLSRSLYNAQTLALGFESDQVDLAGVDLQLAGYDEAGGRAFAADLVRRAHTLPGVVSAASAKVVPLRLSAFSLAGLWRPEQPPDARNVLAADWNLIEGDYFGTIRIPLLRGRSFAETDREGSTEVAIVNATLAQRLWPGEEAVGRTVLYGPADARRPLQIIGVVRDAKYRTPGEAPRAVIHVPLAQHYNSELWLLLRTRGPSTLPALRALLRDMDPDLPLLQATTLTDATAFSLLPSRLAAWLAAIVGGVGILLAAIGIYGLTAYHAVQRTREIGVRMALGATRARIERLVVRQSVRLTGIGLVTGLMLAAAASRLLQALLYDVAALDPLSFAGGAALLAALTIAAALIPARRAAAMDPVTALRAE